MMPIGKIFKDPLHLTGIQEDGAFQTKSYSTSDKREKEVAESENESAQKNVSMEESNRTSINSVYEGKTQQE